MTTTAKPVEGAAYPTGPIDEFPAEDWARWVCDELRVHRDKRAWFAMAIKSRDAAVRRAALEEAARVVQKYGDGGKSPIALIASEIRGLVEG